MTNRHAGGHRLRRLSAICAIIVAAMNWPSCSTHSDSGPSTRADDARETTIDSQTPTTQPDASAALADEVLSAYRNAKRLHLVVDSVYYWWRATPDTGLEIDLDAFPPEGATSKIMARVIADCLPGKSTSRLMTHEYGDRYREVVSFECDGVTIIERNSRSQRATYANPQDIPQTTLDVVDPDRFLCETAMWTAPLVGERSHQGEAFARFIRRGRVIRRGPDGIVVLVEDDDEHNLFRINRDHFVVEWIKVMPLPDDHRVAYVKRITMDASSGIDAARAKRKSQSDASSPGCAAFGASAFVSG